MNLRIDFVREPTPIVRKVSLSLVSKSYTLRCDAKQAEKRFLEFEELINSMEYFYLGEYLPAPFVKGKQPSYIEPSEYVGEPVPVINTLSIQNLTINLEHCKYISEEDYEVLSEDRKLKKGDVLLTMDGGTSIGKPALFNLNGAFTVDSHVAILRPSGLHPKALVYLLASPLGQLQFQQAESGSSGQTAVTEEDVRRFRFPGIQQELLSELVSELDDRRSHIAEEMKRLEREEKQAWKNFNESMLRLARE